MIKTILVRARWDASGVAAYATARCVVRRFGAHVDALHVRPDSVEVAVAMSTEGSGGVLLQGIIDHLDRDADADEAKVRDQFTTFCSEAGLQFVADPAASASSSSMDRTVTVPSSKFKIEIKISSLWRCVLRIYIYIYSVRFAVAKK